MTGRKRCRDCVHWDIIDGGYETDDGIAGVIYGCTMEGYGKMYSDRISTSFACKDDFERSTPQNKEELK